ncbi:MAG TPA: hypothetical protein VFE61_19145 [Candidatus Sulfotelmatobacter sp.]|jgi:hypothetical protein|nr:hypothetical protein [Candidatus Sulfotelmatobacter sp.]
MEAITGVFKTRFEAEYAINEAYKAGIAPDKITLLTPGSVDQINKEMLSVPTDTTEQPGMGKAVGALLGGGVGFAGGSLLMAVVPGLGPITALGLLGAGILGAAGAAVGATAGGIAETATSTGLPEDEIFVYEDALRKGRSVVVALADDESTISFLRNLLRGTGAESVDAARDQWWIGLRSAEESRYAQSGRNFAQDEQFFRLGFQAALHARTRCLEFDQVSGEMNAALEDVQRQYPGAPVEEPFIHGYERGREHYQQLCDETRRAA